MTIEITKGSENPVTDFFSSPSNTPVTDEMKCLSLIEVMELPRERRTIALRVLQAIKERDEARGEQSSIQCAFEDSQDKIEELERERDKVKTELEMWRDGNIMHQIHRDELEKAERERNEARATLTDIHRWIDRNHPDGFIDSLTHLQNLDRITENWYDRLDRLEVDANRFVRERDEARQKYDALATEHMLVINKLCNERDESKSISDDLAIIASHCIGWHDHESSDATIKIAAALKRWKKSKLSNEQD
jgi:chromosome segregation ATPase